MLHPGWGTAEGHHWPAGPLAAATFLSQLCSPRKELLLERVQVGDWLGAVQLPSHAHEPGTPGTSGTRHRSTGCRLGYCSSGTEAARPADLSTGVIFKPPFGILLAKFLNDLG